MPAPYWFDVKHDDGRERRVPARFIRGADRSGSGHAIAVLDGERAGDIRGWGIFGSNVPEPWESLRIQLDGAEALGFKLIHVPDDADDYLARFPQPGHCVWTYVDAERRRYWCAGDVHSLPDVTGTEARLIAGQPQDVRDEIAAKRLELAWTVFGPPHRFTVSGPASGACEPVRWCPTYPPPRGLHRA